ncbi:MAG TPA: IS1595 family transposase [bacterium]|nr:IS1595 family transposase [bacterium]
MKFTLNDFLTTYPDRQSCLKEVMSLKPPCCGEYYFLKKRPVAICKTCKKHFSVLKGTIFEKSSTPLTSWFYAIYMMTKTRTGVSAKQLQREIGVTYKTAWRMMHLIRSVMKPSDKPLRGTVEVDETFVGGKSKNRANYWYASLDKEKSVLLGMVSRGGEVKVKHVPNIGRRTLLKEIESHVAKGNQIYSDHYLGYTALPQYGYKHRWVNHKWQFVQGDTHTQNIENFWSHLKRGITGTYRAVSKKHLQKYADEYAFRYNHRRLEGAMFFVLLNLAVRPREDSPSSLKDL